MHLRKASLIRVFPSEWRTLVPSGFTSTQVPVSSNPQSLFFSWALFSAELFGAVSTFLFFFTVWKPKTRKALPPLSGRSVDVFIPTKNESVAVLRKTLLACKDLRYPHRTLVLDDGNRAEVKALCEELGCVYLARETHEHAKAGNLNYGLKHSDAEFIAVFDADHIPLPHFIDTLISYFEDSKFGFVQVPQEFYNIDSMQHRTDLKKSRFQIGPEERALAAKFGRRFTEYAATVSRWL